MSETKRRAALAGTIAAAGLGASVVGSGFRIRRAAAPLTDRWRDLPIEPRGGTRLGASFRPLQAAAFGLDPLATLQALLGLPIEVVRLAAYWDRLEPGPGRFEPDELDWQIEAAEGAGRQIILAVGAVKAFGYPELFVPAHQLSEPFPEGRRIDPESHPRLLEAARAFVARVVERYRDRPAIVAWQVEHEGVDPLGMEHSWRLGLDFVAAEVAAVREADSSRPIALNGFLPPTLPVRLQQAWRTRGQGDSLAAAGRLADIVGIDYYPRTALLSLGPIGLYLEGGSSRSSISGARRILEHARQTGRRVMVTEGQAEPWETQTPPPASHGLAPSSCRPEHVIENYNAAMRWARDLGQSLDAYLFWGAEYWLRRDLDGDQQYLAAARRIIDEA